MDQLRLREKIDVLVFVVQSKEISRVRNIRKNKFGSRDEIVLLTEQCLLFFGLRILLFTRDECSSVAWNIANSCGIPFLEKPAIFESTKFPVNVFQVNLDMSWFFYGPC